MRNGIPVVFVADDDDDDDDDDHEEQQMQMQMQMQQQEPYPWQRHRCSGVGSMGQMDRIMMSKNDGRMSHIHLTHRESREEHEYGKESYVQSHFNHSRMVNNLDVWINTILFCIHLFIIT